jgi:hypothetical protein
MTIEEYLDGLYEMLADGIYWLRSAKTEEELERVRFHVFSPKSGQLRRASELVRQVCDSTDKIKASREFVVIRAALVYQLNRSIECICKCPTPPKYESL